MNMEYPEEETMLQDYKDKDDDFINKEDVDCVGVWQSSRDSRPVEILEPQWDKYN